MINNEDTQRNPGTAVALGFLLPGLGQVYCGALLRGLFFMGLGVVLLILAVLADLSEALSGTLWPPLIYGSAFVISLVALIDSYRLARRTREDYRLKEYNRWQVYALLVVISSGGGLGYGLYVREALMQAFRIPNPSMYPSLRVGDNVLANKRAYLDRDPEIGEVVIFPSPENRERKYVKRVVAVAGDTVEVRAGELYVNGEKLATKTGAARTVRQKEDEVPGHIVWETGGERRYPIFLPDDAAKRAKNDAEPIVVPKNHVFVLGDNRSFSHDSRHFGPVPVAAVVAKLSWITWPGEDVSRFGRFEPSDS